MTVDAKHSPESLQHARLGAIECKDEFGKLEATELAESEKELEGAITALLDACTTPAIENIYSVDYAEDGKTLVVMIEFVDGRTGMWQFCPGYPVQEGYV